MLGDFEQIVQSSFSRVSRDFAHISEFFYDEIQNLIFYQFLPIVCLIQCPSRCRRSRLSTPPFIFFILSPVLAALRHLLFFVVLLSLVLCSNMSNRYSLFLRDMSIYDVGDHGSPQLL